LSKTPRLPRTYPWRGVMRPASDTKTRDFAQYSCCPGLDGLEVMSARWVEHSFAPHMHDFYAVSLNYRGRGAFDCGHQVHDAAPGTCNLIAPGELHTGRATCGDGWTYRNLHIEAPLMTRLLYSIEWPGPFDVRFKSSLVSDVVLRTRLACVFASLTESSSLLEHESLLLSVLARLITDHIVDGRALRGAGREHVAITRAMEWLDANSEQNVSIRSLADVAGLSPYYLVRAFHRQVGVPPHRYQTILRVNRARRLLTSGLALSDVAYRTGFYDQSHLTRCFKRTLGVTPGRYSASHIEARATACASEHRRGDIPDHVQQKVNVGRSQPVIDAARTQRRPSTDLRP
jgi:AraC-like DNA-binding protein